PHGSHRHEGPRLQTPPLPATALRGRDGPATQPMRLYLDDDTAFPLLARLLRQAGHDVELPADAGLAGKDDPVHLTHAIEVDRVCLSQNYRDFENLHNLVIRSGGHHPGIFMVRRDNDPRRDLSPR